jgi:hypothetical protein
VGWGACCLLEKDNSIYLRFIQQKKVELTLQSMSREGGKVDIFVHKLPVGGLEDLLQAPSRVGQLLPVIYQFSQQTQVKIRRLSREGER